jgi:uncharacterized protein YndB with AHSA1/START domain
LSITRTCFNGNKHRLVFTELWDEDWTGGEAVVTMALAEQAGKTTLAMTVLYASRAARDAVLKTPMEQGMAQSYNRLDELLAVTPAEADTAITETGP